MSSAAPPRRSKPTHRKSSRSDRMPELTPAERAARGKAARAEVPRSSHAMFDVPRSRPDPIALLESQAQSRVPDLVPIRYGRMLASPFAFYRGGALLMASDLAATPRSGLGAQLCGDAHLLNFGMFGTPERRLVFDLNDFDETLPGPWEWDVKRLAASVVVAGRDNGFTAAENRSVVLATAGAYREAMATFAAAANLAVWYANLDVDEVMATLRPQMDARRRKQSKRNLAKTRSRDSHQALEKLTEVVNGQRRIISDPPLLVPIEELFGERELAELYGDLDSLVREYRRTLQEDRRYLLSQYRLVQIARKVVGVGSVGTRAFVLLMFGRDGDDPLFLQAKEAQPSVLAKYVGAEFRDSASVDTGESVNAGESGDAGSRNEGRRVVDGQRRMQATSDIFLGWQRIPGMPTPGASGVSARDFYLRQLRDWKGSVLVETLNPAELAAYGRICGQTLARAHARSGDRIAIAAYLGSSDTFDRAIADFAQACADQNERDHQALVDAVRSGRVTAETGR
jgi:uncharacterized protein (DUF2252 family)